MLKGFGFCFHVAITGLNGLLCLANLAVGNWSGATLSGVLAAVLAWQLTW
jgi:hypothetical protein